jgi:hypothetical protein
MLPFNEVSMLLPDIVNQFTGVPVIEVSVYNDMTSTDYYVVVTLDSSGSKIGDVARFYCISVNKNRVCRITRQQSLQLDLAAWMKDRGKNTLRYGVKFAEHINTFLREKRKKGYRDGRFLYANELMELLQYSSSSPPYGLLRTIGFDTTSQDISAFNAKLPEIFYERGLIDRKAVNVPVAKRLSKEDWLKANYPELKELPKWRFPAVVAG